MAAEGAGLVSGGTLPKSHVRWLGESGQPTRGLLATDHVILNHGQVTWTTPELAPSLLTTTPHQREDVSALDRFNVHRCPTWRVFSGTGLEPVTKQATVRYLYHSATAATLGHDSIFINGCGNNDFCSSESQGDFRLSQLGSLIGFLVGSLITWEIFCMKLVRVTYDNLSSDLWHYQTFGDGPRKI
ncbi:uncharacterized protein TNCV_1782151 [Trichonephila clavipes]|nr:uncharacterized protein TNCV_1782151 [Trichonephila clavipes]